MHDEPAGGGVILTERAVPFHRHTRDPVMADALPQHVVRGREHLVEVRGGERNEEEIVARPVVVQLWGIFRERRLDVDDDWEFVVVDLDELQRVFGDVTRVRHDRRDRLPHVSDPVERERMPRDLLEGWNHGKAM